MKKGILVVVSGFSGAGKGTIMKKLMSEKADAQDDAKIIEEYVREVKGQA